MSTPDNVLSVLENFVDDLNNQVDIHRLEEILQGQDTITGADVGSKPEPWTRHHLIRPLLQAVDLEYEPEIHGQGEGYPDFGIMKLDLLVIGEDKSINKIEDAEEDIKNYLNNRAASRGAEYGVATDGITWSIYRIELGGDYLDYEKIDPTPIDFREELLQIARDKNYITQSGVVKVDVDEKAETFFETFSRDKFNTLITQEAPKRIRAKKKAGIEEFYNLYVELLFGEGSGSYDYDTTLLDDIQAPEDATDTDKRKFAIKLVNRLLFVKFLQDRGVMPANFLSERVEKYQQAQEEIDEFGGGLYKTQIEPIFFNLFNTDKDDRISKHRGSWFDEVHYLNGSLFAPDDRERQYDVDDRMLITVVTDLVEGHKLESNGNGNGGVEGIDPSVLGHVFEMTINHLSSGESQKDEGAYYTPSDVIRLITDKSVDPKIYEILVDVYGKRLSEGSDLSEDHARSLVSNYDMGEMLREIEQREGYFSDSQAIQEAYDRLGELKVIDPACGSGHFLTGVLDEIHRVRMSLLRGLKGSELEDKDVYQAKKDLVLSSIYGVDINPIAIEIAKLRVWLKMVEEGWERDYGELPNIDINIVDGNSLIGLPAKSDGQASLKSFEIDISSITDVREEYKSGEISRSELNRRVEELRPEFRDYYLSRVNHYIEERITEPDYWSRVVGELDQVYPAVRKITLRREDNEQLSDTQKDLLDELGFYVEPRYGKSAKVEEGDIDKIDTNEYRGMLEDGLLFDVERQPVGYDLDQLEELKERENRAALSYDPFHWPVEFPEAVTPSDNGNRYDVEFDIVVGNPPYGPVLEDVEKRFTRGYQAGSLNDIVAPFIEREIQILKEDGYFGNIVALMFAYQTNAAPVRDLLRDQLAETQVACFTRRPSQVFEGSQARTGIITGRKQDGGDEQSIQTSKFLRFNEDNRREVFTNISYESTADLNLGERIGSGEDKSLPKVGNETIRSILEKLKNNSDTVFRDKMRRGESNETEYVVYRSYHPSYFANPYMENLWPPEDESRDFKPMYFESQLDREFAFLVMQSSLYYLYWMVFENERDLNWKTVEAFPFPDNEDLREKSDEISELAGVLWGEMSGRFLGNIREEFDTIAAVKPITDEVDDLLCPMFGLSDEEIEYVKSYDEEYRLSDVDQTQLVEFEVSFVEEARVESED